MTSQTQNRYIRLGLRWKLLLPFILLAIVVGFGLYPYVSNLVTTSIGDELDIILRGNAVSVSQLLTQQRTEVVLDAQFIAKLPEVVAIRTKEDAEAILPARREQLAIEELSYYTADYQSGQPAFYYAGPTVARRLQSSQSLRESRDNLLRVALETGEAGSVIALAPQSSQIIGAAPVKNGDQVIGAIVAVSYLDDALLLQYSEVLSVDIAIESNNAIVVSTIDASSGYEQLVKAGFLSADGSPTSTDITYPDGSQRRLYAQGIILDGQMQGHVLVARAIGGFVQMQTRLQSALLTLVGVMLITMIGYGVSVFFSFVRPITHLSQATAQVSMGDLDQRIVVANTMVRDEIYDLGTNFNAMTQKLDVLYETLEQRVAERTRELSDANRELAVTRDKALEANKSKSVFLANMSHELRTPLNAIIGYSEMLQEDAHDFGYDDIVPDLEKIQKAGTHLLSVINDILDLSKIEAGKMELYLETFALSGLIEDIVSTIKPVTEKNHNQLVVNMGSGVGQVHLDQTKLRQVVFNLLSNAAKFTNNGTITLDVYREALAGDDWVLIRVRDTGIGMTPEQVKIIFQEFTQADSSTTRKYGGTGLGLPISRHFCQMMGGNIEVDSEVGHGSSFTVRLPVTANRGEKTKTSTSEFKAVRVTTPHRNNLVLVIDDDPQVHDLLQRTLTKEGFDVITTNSGDEGLRIARERHPQAITLDVMMPEMDGWTVLAKIKSEPELAHIPVVMLTMLDNKNLGFALGATGYLMKPVDRSQLLALLAPIRERVHDSARVLVIEDDPEIRELVRRTLEKEAWLVDEAENGLMGLQRMNEQLPHVILLDLMMPEMDGLEFLQEIRKREAWRGIPIVVVTAKELNEFDYQQLNGNVQRVLQKGSYSREELLREVAELVKSFAQSNEPTIQD